MITIINLQLPQMITIITLLCSRKTTMASTSTPLLSQTQDIASLVIGCGYHNNHPDDDDDDDDDDDCVAHLRQTPRTAGTSSSSSSHSKTAVKNSVPETWRMLMMILMMAMMTLALNFHHYVVSKTFPAEESFLLRRLVLLGT